MKRLLKVTAMTGLLTLLKMVMGFVIAKVVAVYTGPTGLAMLGQVQGVVAVLNGLINAPAANGVVRYTAEKQAEGYEACSLWWKASLQWILILAGITIPVVLLLSDYLAILLFQDEALSWVITVTVCVLPLSAIGTLCNSVINGQQNYRRYVGLGMLSAIISAALMLGMIFYANIKGALLAAALQSALIGLVMLSANLRQPWFKLRYWWGTTSVTARKSIGNYTLMAITTALTVPVSLILVRNILVEQVGWESTGHWQAVWKISEVYLSVITIALGTYYLPKLSSLIGVDSIVKEIHHTAKVIFPIVCIMALGVYLLRDVAIWLLFTEEFKAARDLFAIQLTGDVVKILAWLYAYPMLSRGATKWFISTEIFFSTNFIFLSYLFVDIYGVKGASIAYLVNYILYFLFVFLNVKRFSL
ncbi:O-antigen translocase [Shewanella inventionis]|uniref:O-antigen translocase n=1 Tax=Shewanella inventionis TaxID=1738770 RepID=UPI001CC19085|nr:O-antigen translocase [Shewanella inventionis]UAL42642.1 O-antigen translocase [Shewanella inventionis]